MTQAFSGDIDMIDTLIFIRLWELQQVVLHLLHL